MAHVEDRWMVPGPNGRKVKGPRHGQGSRWLAVWHETDGRRRKRAFKSKDAAQGHGPNIPVGKATLEALGEPRRKASCGRRRPAEP